MTPFYSWVKENGKESTTWINNGYNNDMLVGYIEILKINYKLQEYTFQAVQKNLSNVS